MHADRSYIARVSQSACELRCICGLVCGLIGECDKYRNENNAFRRNPSPPTDPARGSRREPPNYLASPQMPLPRQPSSASSRTAVVCNSSSCARHPPDVSSVDGAAEHGSWRLRCHRNRRIQKCRFSKGLMRHINFPLDATPTLGIWRCLPENRAGHPPP